jgi:hypothetical protein
MQNHCVKMEVNGFFHARNNGEVVKLNEERICEAQALLDKFYSVAEVARSVGVTEGALRYHIRKGSLKKKRPL